MSQVPDALPSDVGTKLLAIHDALDAVSITHAFGGAIALDYAVPDPRATYDIDVNISVAVEDADRVLAALPDGITARPDVLKRIREHGQDRLRWGDVPVDLFFPQHEFHRVVASRTQPKPFRGSVIRVISPTDLTVFKVMFNRRKDWPDIDAMLRAGSVDEREALGWVAVILGDDHPSYTKLTRAIAEARNCSDDEEDGDPNPWRSLHQGGGKTPEPTA